MDTNGRSANYSIPHRSSRSQTDLNSLLGAFFHRNRILFVSWLVFLLPFLVTRLPYFLKYPIVIFNIDDGGYFQIVDQINKGFAPHLSIRTIGYPLFLKSISLLSDKNFSVIVAQHVVTLLCCCFFIFVFFRVYRKRPFVPIATALALGIFATSGTHLISDCTIMTDSLFVNLIILALALLVSGLFSRRDRPLFLSSLVIGYAILVRPAGLFLIPVLLAILIVAMIKNFPRRSILCLSCPLAFILLVTVLYNHFTIDSFSISTFTENSLISYTSILLEKRSGYGPVTNQAILHCQRASQRSNIGKLDESWNYSLIRRMQKKCFEKNRVRIARVFFNHEDPGTYDLYLKWRPDWRKMGLDAIRRHPRLFFKLFYSALLTNLFTRIGYDKDFYAVIKGASAVAFALKKRFRGFAEPQDPFNRRFNTLNYSRTLSDQFLRLMLKEYYDPRPFPDGSEFPDGKNGLRPSIWERIHQFYYTYHRILFRNIYWTLLFLATSIYSGFRLSKSRLRHLGVLFSFILTFAALMYILFISISAFPYQRYSYAMEFIYYLSPLLLIISSIPAPEPE